MAVLDLQYIAKLATHAKMGNSDAFAELYAATYQKEYAFAYRYLKDQYLAQDAIQETYILAFKNIMDLKDPNLFVSWLNRICFRTCFDIHRKNDLYHNEMAEYNDEMAEHIDSRRSEKSVEEQVITIDEKSYIARQILSLPLSESQAIILRYYHNMKLDDIASLMGISRSSVKRYIKSGLARLKKIIKT